MQNKVIIVDDSLTIRQQVTFILNDADFEVVEAKNGAEGLQVIEANPDIKAIILDINMPQMNGMEMLREARARGIKKPIIMLTTEGSNDLVQQAKSLGANGWIVKPFQPEDLIGALNQLID